MNWRIQWSKSAIRDIKKLNEPDKSRIWETLEKLIKQPQQADIKKLKGKAGEYRLRVGEWRIRFRADSINKVYLITHVQHRRDVYK